MALDEDWRPVRGSEETLEVAAVCFAWSAVPSIQLSQMCGAEHRYVAERGGWVPVVSAEMETTVPGVLSAGDGAGLGGAAMAALEGRIAGHRRGRATRRALARSRPVAAPAASVARWPRSENPVTASGASSRRGRGWPS